MYATSTEYNMTCSIHAGVRYQVCLFCLYSWWPEIRKHEKKSLLASCRSAGSATALAPHWLAHSLGSWCLSYPSSYSCQGNTPWSIQYGHASGTCQLGTGCSEKILVPCWGSKHAACSSCHRWSSLELSENGSWRLRMGVLEIRVTWESQTRSKRHACRR